MTPYLNYFAVRSFNQAYTRGYLSVSQRQGVITCLPKEGKYKFYLQNWRPMSLLNAASLSSKFNFLIKGLFSSTNMKWLSLTTVLYWYIRIHKICVVVSEYHPGL
jgi:hypothetical protein